LRVDQQPEIPAPRSAESKQRDAGKMQAP